MGGMAGARLPSSCSSAVLAASWCRKICNHPPVVNLMRTSAPRAFIHFIHFILSAINLGSDHQDTQAPQVAPLLANTVYSKVPTMYSRLHCILGSLPCVESSNIFCCNSCTSNIRRCVDYNVCQESRATPVISAVDGLRLS